MRPTLLFVFFFATNVVFGTDKIAPNLEKIAAVRNGACAEARASWWGFDPDDSTDALQKAFDSGVPKLIVDKQAGPWVVRPLYLRSQQEIIFEPDVEIQAKRGEFRGGGDSLLCLNAVRDVSIRGAGGTLRMWKSDYLAPPYELAEWRHAIELCAAKNVSIENLSIVESGGDGIYVGATPNGPCENIELRGVVSDGNNRQGISVISVRGLRVVDCVFKNTGGTNPSAGVDFEPNGPRDFLENVLFENCVFEKNASDGISFYLVQLDETSPALDVVFRNCKTVLNGKAGFQWTSPPGRRGLRGKIVVEKTTFDADVDGIRIENKSVGGHFLEFHDVEIKNAASRVYDKNRAARSPITLLSGVRDSAPFGGILFENVQIVDSIDREPLYYRDGSRSGVGLRDVRGTLETRRSDDGPVVRTDSLDDRYFAERFPDVNPNGVPLIETRQNDFLPFEVAFESENSGAKNESTPKNAPGVRARNQGDFRLFAQKGDHISFTLQEFPYAMIAKDPVKLEWTAPDGETSELEPLEFLGTRTYELDAAQTGVYRLYFDVNPHDVQFSNCNVPFVFWAEPYAMTMEYAQSFYFYVPKGSENLGLKFDDGTYLARVVDPSGGVRWDGRRLPPIFFPEKEIEPGIWEVRFEQDGDKPLGTVCFNLLGVPSCLATTKNAVFVPVSRSNATVPTPSSNKSN